MKAGSQALVSLLEPLRGICQAAGAAIVDIYHASEPVAVELKSDLSPLTAADQQAHKIIVAGLKALTPHWPVLSEEQVVPEFSERSQWRRYWLVDPLDGTREFIDRTGEFTINIALIEDNKPVLGVVYLPLDQVAYMGVPLQKYALKVDGQGRQALQVSSGEQCGPLRVVTSSRYKKNDQLLACIHRLEQNVGTVEWVTAGSALKFCRLAEGVADIYPRFSPCCEWDTAAGHAVLEAAGGHLLDTAFCPLRYNQQPSLISPSFYGCGGTLLDWRRLLSE